MNAIITHECSGRVRQAMRLRGIDAWSCDLKPAEDSSPYHLQMDAIGALQGLCPSNGLPWDFHGSHPVCTYLANSGVRWLYQRGTGFKVQARWDALLDAAAHFRHVMLASAHIRCGYIENPIMHQHARELIFGGRSELHGFDAKPQCVQPWMFGHMETKATCLWTKRLPRLEETNNVKELMLALPKAQTHLVHYCSPGPERQAMRSRTLQGLADAIAEQWGPR